MSVKKPSASKCYIIEDYFLSYFIFVYNMLKWTCWTRAYIVLLSQIKIPDTSGVDFNFVCYETPKNNRIWIYQNICVLNTRGLLKTYIN